MTPEPPSKRKKKKPTFDLMSKRCDECLFTKNKIVSDERRDQIIKDIYAANTHFLCHKSQKIACRGYVDERGGGMAYALARFLGIVRYINPSTLKPVKKN